MADNFKERVASLVGRIREGWHEVFKDDYVERIRREMDVKASEWDYPVEDGSCSIESPVGSEGLTNSVK